MSIEKVIGNGQQKCRCLCVATLLESGSACVSNTQEVLALELAQLMPDQLSVREVCWIQSSQVAKLQGPLYDTPHFQLMRSLLTQVRSVHNEACSEALCIIDCSLPVPCCVNCSCDLVQER